MSIECACFGTLGRDAELKKSATGKTYLRLNVRVGDGPAAQWLSVMVFDQSAIDVAARMVKGARVYIEGSITSNEWIGQDGKLRHGLSVMSWHCRLSQIGRNKSPKPKPEKPKALAAVSIIPDEDDIRF
jgi:single-stranded DNA-binding protein